MFSYLFSIPSIVLCLAALAVVIASAYAAADIAWMDRGICAKSEADDAALGDIVEEARALMGRQYGAFVILAALAAMGAIELTAWPVDGLTAFRGVVVGAVLVIQTLAFGALGGRLIRLREMREAFPQAAAQRGTLELA